MKHIFDSNSFSREIRQKRIIELNVGVREIAKKTKISSATISRLENGKKPDITTYASICEWLDVPLTKFIKKQKGK